MCCDYGFRSGVGRLYQGRTGEVPKNFFALVYTHCLPCVQHCGPCFMLCLLLITSRLLALCPSSCSVWRHHLQVACCYCYTACCLADCSLSGALHAVKHIAWYVLPCLLSGTTAAFLHQALLPALLPKLGETLHLMHQLTRVSYQVCCNAGCRQLCQRV